MRDIIARKISFCIELRDAFTNKRIESENINVYVRGYAAAVKKEQKYYVFLDIREDMAEVCIESPVYERKNCVIFFREYDKKQSIGDIQDVVVSDMSGIRLFLITLYPNERYVLPSGYERIVLDGRPQEELRVIRDETEGFLLAADYQGGRILQMMMPDKVCVEGIKLRIMEKEGECYEDFTVLEKKGFFQYTIDAPLTGQYLKGSRIFELYCVRADEEGKASVIVRSDILHG